MPRRSGLSIGEASSRISICRGSRPRCSSSAESIRRTFTTPASARAATVRCFIRIAAMPGEVDETLQLRRIRLATFKARIPRRGTVFKVISISFVVVLVLIAALALYVYKQSVGKLEIRRLSLPTRIFTDFTPLRGGVVLGPDDLVEKLNRLGYRQADALAQAGDYVPGSSQIDV